MTGASSLPVTSRSHAARNRTGELELSTNPWSPAAGPLVMVADFEAGAHASLSVYDVHGRLLRQLLDRTVADGLLQAGWDGRDARGVRLASGVYYLRLETPRMSTTRPLLLLW